MVEIQIQVQDRLYKRKRLVGKQIVHIKRMPRRYAYALTFEVLLSGRSERASQGTAMDEISRWYSRVQTFSIAKYILTAHPFLVFLHINGRTDSCR